MRRFFGKSSEKIDSAQLELLLKFPEEETGRGKSPPSPCSGPAADTWEAPAATHSGPQRAKSRKPRLPEHLPVEDQVSEPEEVHAEPAGGGSVKKSASSSTTGPPVFPPPHGASEIRAQRGHGTPAVIAPLPPSLQDACLAAPGLIAAVIAGKYCDHLPLGRQEQIYQTRHGVALPRQTLCRWVALAGFWLRPLYEKIKTTVRDGHYEQVDETPVEF